MRLKQAFCDGIKNLAKEHDNVMLVESDVQSGVREWFLKEVPNQYLDTGIAECNAIGICAGLESEGYVPFWYTYGFLVDMVFSQIKQSIARDNRNVKIFGFNCGVSIDGKLGGASHNCVEDIGLMRLLPGMTIVVPADGSQLYQSVKAAYECKGPVYVRFGAGDFPDIVDNNFKIGKASLLREGKKLTVVCNGIMVSSVLETADKYGDIEVLNMSTVKPLDRNTLFKSAIKTGEVAVLEENYLNGGMGEHIARLFGQTDIKIHCLGIKDIWMQSGKGDLRDKYNLDVKSVEEFIRGIIND
jgi:transketolase